MSDIRVAREFFQCHIPSRLYQLMDPQSLKPCKESYVDEELKRSITDVLYQAKFNGQTGYIYILVEHQSTVDHSMAFRFLNYILRIMEDHVKQHGCPYPISFIPYCSIKERGPIRGH